MIVTTENHREVEHLASFLILELIQMTQRQDHVTPLTPQLLVVSLVKVTSKTTFSGSASLTHLSIHSQGSSMVAPPNAPGL